MNDLLTIEEKGVYPSYTRRDGLWYQRVTDTDVVNWEGPEEVPMQLTHDGTNL